MTCHPAGPKRSEGAAERLDPARCVALRAGEPLRHHLELETLLTDIEASTPARQTWYRTEVLPLGDTASEVLNETASATANLSVQAVTQLTRALSPGTVVSDGLLVSSCDRCDELAIWIQGRLLWPGGGVAPAPNADLPGDVARDYREAASIVRESRMGAAALLRLAVEKLCHSLVSPEKGLNECIATLVRQGLDPEIHQALDYVRVIGNNAVYPGRMDLDDD